MLSATRRWFQRNRTPIAIGVGVVGAGYLATQYVLGKINDARERMSSDRIAKENLRRRFEQNQEDCTFTVLALLPTATTNILEAMNTEKITLEIQQMKGAARSAKAGEHAATPPSIADTTLTEEEGKSVASLQSESGVHASQVVLPTPSAAGEGAQEGVQTAPTAQKTRRTKRQLWDDLTISSITRAFTLVYTLSLLTMLTRVQLNLLGRRSYLSSVVSLATGTMQSTISLENNDDNDDDNAEQVYGSDFDTNRKYLTFSWWLLNRGWIDVGERVEEAVRDVFGHLSPRDLLSFDQFWQLTLEVRKKVEGRAETDRKGSKWLPNLLPPSTLEDFVLRESGVLGESATAETQTETSSPSTTAPSLRRLLDETSDLIDSPAFSHVLTLLLDAGFSVLLSKKLLQGAFELTATIPELEEEQASKIVLLPKILSVLTRQAHAIGNGMPNEYLQEMEQVPNLEAFAAVVYSSNWENEVQQNGLSVQAVEDVGKLAPESSMRPTQASGVPTLDDESVVLVDNEAMPASFNEPSQMSFESVWERTVEQKRG
ncbi:Peroxin-3 family protein [Pseudomassariella vexata]|uniref:Peroxin-3 family protein n=1 Tax=Pseudomassariella vexata TaxID=1141098 RepID=A0A1Y2EF88_9PEZI|nr:Peroxin-3 family protein [Pseudomassariella vexata]ORY69936.1 Peroxin-3 family protein [Pseudomassariella vexata]